MRSCTFRVGATGGARGAAVQDYSTDGGSVKIV